MKIFLLRSILFFICTFIGYVLGIRRGTKQGYEEGRKQGRSEGYKLWHHSYIEHVKEKAKADYERSLKGE